MEAQDDFLKNLVNETQNVSRSLSDGINLINSGLNSDEFKNYKNSLSSEKTKDLESILKSVKEDLSKSMEAVINISKVK